MNISEKKRFSLVFGFLAIVLIPFVSAQYFGFLDFYSLADMYDAYYQWFDLIIYYMIFGSLARLVFEKRFGENEHAVTALYNGVAIFMSLGLVLYESRSGGSLLIAGGRWIFLVALLIAGVGLYSILRALTGWGILRCVLISSLVILFLAYGFRDVSGVKFSETLSNTLQWLFIIVLGGLLIWGTKWAVSGRGNTASTQKIIVEPKKIKRQEDSEKPGDEESSREVIVSTGNLTASVNGLTNLILIITKVLGRAVNKVGQIEDKQGLEETKTRSGLVMKIIPSLRRLESCIPLCVKLKEFIPHIERTDLGLDQRLRICNEVKGLLKEVKNSLKGLKRKRRIIRMIDRYIITYYIGRQFAHTESQVIQAYGISGALLNEVDRLRKELKG